MVGYCLSMNKITPYLDEDGTLVIPFECSDHAYKYWKQEGKPLGDILAELGVPDDIRLRYTQTPCAETAPDEPGESENPDKLSVGGVAEDAVLPVTMEPIASAEGDAPPPEAWGDSLAVAQGDSPPAD
jgi:hypothetical protein